MTISLNRDSPGTLSLDDAKTEVNKWKEDVVAVFDAKNGCVLFTPNFGYNGKYSVCYSDNKGGFMLTDPYTNTVVDGDRFDLTADAVISICDERKSA